MDEGEVIREFHRLYYNSPVIQHGTRWRGVRTLKCPLDLWIYQEILQETQPDFVVETGTAFGGSAYFMASFLDHLGKGEVITVDLELAKTRPTHPRIRYITGSSTSPEVVGEIKDRITGKKTMVVLDSDHRKDHVLSELRTYAPVVTPECYLVVEDTNLNGYPVREEYGPGPHEALGEFLKENGDFEVDRRREKFFMTLNPGGYLRKRPA